MGTKSAGAYSVVEELVDVRWCEHWVWGIGAEDCASYVELEEGGAMVGARGLGAAVKKSVMRRLLFSVSRGGGGHGSRGECVPACPLRWWVIWICFRFLGGRGRMGFLSSCIRDFFGGGAFTESGRLSGGGW